MQIVITASTKAAAEQAIARLQGIEGITIQEKPASAKGRKAKPTALLGKIERGIQHAKAVEEGKASGRSALDFIGESR
jgi:hypothetical protein